MSPVLQLGPLALSGDVLAALVVLAIAWYAGLRSARKRGVDAERALWLATGVGLLAARIGFVLQWSGNYLQQPWSILDLRDGGWDLAVGGAAAVLTGWSLVRRTPALGKPLRTAGIAAAVLGMLASTGLAMLSVGEARMPALQLSTLDGAPARLLEYEGKPLVLNLWATWCGPCRREMPVLQRAQQQRPDVRIVMVNQGEPADRVRAFLAREGLQFGDMLLDPTMETGRAFGSRALPVTLFFDASGTLRASRIGELSEATLAQRLAAIAGRPQPR